MYHLCIKLHSAQETKNILKCEKNKKKIYVLRFFLHKKLSIIFLSHTGTISFFPVSHISLLTFLLYLQLFPYYASRPSVHLLFDPQFSPSISLFTSLSTGPHVNPSFLSVSSCQSLNYLSISPFLRLFSLFPALRNHGLDPCG